MRSIVADTVYEQTGGISLMGRGRLGDGRYLTRAIIESITLKVFDASDPTTIINGDDGEDIDPDDVIFDTPRLTDPDTGEVIWTKDATGFNFRHKTKASYLPGGGRKFRLEYEVLPTGVDAESFFLPFELSTMSLYSV